jgi:3-phenylpropionate/trans-cinnamate dioxygenase ferredoxin subunit
VTEIDVAPLEELPPGSVKIVDAGHVIVGVYNLNGELYAIEDRCSHDDGPLAEGEFDPEEGVAICPRHGSKFDIRSGRPLTLPAYVPVDTFPVRVDENGIVKLDVA